MPKEDKYELTHHKADEEFLISVVHMHSQSLMKKMHFHDHYEITLIQSTKVQSYENSIIDEYYINDLKYSFDSETFMLASPKTKHMTTCGKNTKRTIINFRHNFAVSIFQFLNIDIDRFFQRHVIKIDTKRTDYVNNLVTSLHKEYTSHGVSTKLKLLFAELLYTLSESEDKPVPHFVNDIKIAPVIDYIKSFYDTPINLDFLAKKFFISKYTICREIKNVTGLTFSEYLTQLRLENARTLLIKSNYSVSEIAKQVGFSTAEYFSKTFKKQFSISPTDYKKQYFKPEQCN